MSIEFIGTASPREGSETIAPSGPVVQPDYVRALARAHERSGFDRVLVAHTSSMPDGFIIADHTLAATERLGVLLAHRPGFVAPTIAARAFATIDAFYPGRIAMHVITGGDEADQHRDGDWLEKSDRYRRSGEFLKVVKQEWSSDERFSYEGEHYHVADAWSSVRPDSGHIPIYFGGASAEAVTVAAEQADVYALWGEPLAGVRERITAAQTAAAEHGRTLKFSLSLRPITADTEELAWERAREILRVTEERLAEFYKQTGDLKSFTRESEGSRRLLRFAEQSEVADERLFTAVSKATGGGGNSTALVGTAEQVANALLRYVEVGVTTLLIRGYNPYDDAVAYGDVISIVREKLAQSGHTGHRDDRDLAGV